MRFPFDVLLLRANLKGIGDIKAEEKQWFSPLATPAPHFSHLCNSADALSDCVSAIGGRAHAPRGSMEGQVGGSCRHSRWDAALCCTLSVTELGTDPWVPPKSQNNAEWLLCTAGFGMSAGAPWLTFFQALFSTIWSPFRVSPLGPFCRGGTPNFGDLVLSPFSCSPLAETAAAQHLDSSALSEATWSDPSKAASRTFLSSYARSLPGAYSSSSLWWESGGWHGWRRIALTGSWPSSFCRWSLKWW